LRLQNLAAARTSAALRFTHPPSAAAASDPIEHRGEALPLEGSRLAVDLAPLQVRTVLIDFGP
jgi:hypothetical protein